MKWAFRNKTAEERLKMAIFKLLALSYFSMLLVQNSLRYINIMTFESILSVFLFKTGMFLRIKN